MVDAIHWTTWNPSTGKTTAHKTHAVDVEAPSRTACGIALPDTPVEVHRGESMSGWCERCKSLLEDSLGFRIG